MNSKTLFLCFTLTVIISSTLGSPNDIRVSKDWYRKHGCPKKPHAGVFQIDCNVCECKVGTSKHGRCGQQLCDTVTKDDYENGRECEAGEEFFSGCRVCKCNAEGTNAHCNDRACELYF